MRNTLLTSQISSEWAVHVGSEIVVARGGKLPFAASITKVWKARWSSLAVRLKRLQQQVQPERHMVHPVIGALGHQPA